MVLKKGQNFKRHTKKIKGGEKEFVQGVQYGYPAKGRVHSPNAL